MFGPVCVEQATYEKLPHTFYIGKLDYVMQAH